MGVAVSNWRLANAVSRNGQLGVVSGTALDQVLARRLQDGDPGGHMRRAIEHFPFRNLAVRVLADYFNEGGRKPGEGYRRLPMHTVEGPAELIDLCVIANFVEVFLAKEGHSNPVGINFLEKIQIPHLASIYGAMLAGVDYILMGAGIPLKIPGAIDALALHQPASYPLAVTGGAVNADDATVHFDPKTYEGVSELAPLRRPFFLAIISSNTLALTMVKKASGRVDGFVVEGPTAGGHNAPPRGKMQLNDAGEPIYGERDEVDLVKLRELGLPFWLAGGYGSAAKLREALEAGAAGVQIGTAFAFCQESGLTDDYRRTVVEHVLAGDARRVFTDPVASPTDFPFKCVPVEGTVSEAETYAERPRICDLGYLREAYRAEDGSLGFRCASEPVTVYVSKGGKPENTENRKCLCNALMANIGLAQVRNNGYVEKGLLTSGLDLTEITQFFEPGRSSYTASDVIRKLTSEVAVEELEPVCAASAASD